MIPKKFLIFDAGPIISLAMNGLLGTLARLKESAKDVEFIATPQVKHEIVDRPLKIKKYEWEGVRVKRLFEDGVLVDSFKFVKNPDLEREIKNIKKAGDNIFTARNEKVRLIQDGEISCLAFSRLCKRENVIVVDERTVRMLTENPQSLKNLMERKLHTKIQIDQTQIKTFKPFKFIRSAELLFVAYKKNLFKYKKTKLLLDALLNAVKHKGSAISSNEITKIKSLV